MSATLRSRSHSALVPLSLLGVLSACAPAGPPVPQVDGVLANVDGEVRRITEEEAKSVCKGASCEPNTVYELQLGKAVPVSFSPGSGKEKIDYSRTILGMQRAWKKSLGSKDIVVAVIDTGADLTHPDLKANLYVNQAEKNGKPGIDDDGNGYVDDVTGYDFVNDRPNAVDDNNHGTHCSGIIAAAANGVGTVGIAPNVKILPVKFMDANGRGTKLAALNAIKYAVASGAKVLSNSWGGYVRSDFLADAIADAQAKGVVVVAAAGNEANDNNVLPSYPASYTGVVSVASTTSADELSSFSNHGSASVLLAAPGSNILSSVVGGGWAKMSGTSMAAPQVAGAVALALSVNPKTTAAEIPKKLCDASVPAHIDGATVCGRLDVARLVGVN